LEAVNTVLFVTAVLGVPVIAPFVARVRPAGRFEELKVSGVVPLAVTMLLKAKPTVPLKELVDVNTGT
jgi:hypothetical protein